jgi:hypothetical protein
VEIKRRKVKTKTERRTALNGDIRSSELEMGCCTTPLSKSVKHQIAGSICRRFLNVNDEFFSFRQTGPSHARGGSNAGVAGALLLSGWRFGADFFEGDDALAFED